MDQHTHEAGEIHDHDRGLSHDLPLIARRSMGRRGLFAVLGGVGAVTVAGCASDSSDGSGAARHPQARTTVAGRRNHRVEMPTSRSRRARSPRRPAGPFPGDGSNGVNVLTESGVVRSDITSSFGSASGTAEGVPLTIRMKVYDLTGDDATVLAGAAVYAWHCDREGRYSLYSEGVEDENYLRGVQAADAQGYVEFRSIFPAAYDGRWPHVHFEVYPSLDDATSASNKLRTSQLALPEDVCEKVYATDGYEASADNLSQTTLDSDNVFSDGYSLQMAKVTGSNDEG